MSAAPTADVLGVLDWGIGGLGVVDSLRAHGIATSIVYLSDTAAIPYGRLPTPQLTERVEQAIGTLVGLGATRILIACNAASTVIPRLQARVPTTGMIDPALRSLVYDKAPTAGVIGGARTIASGLYRRGLARPGREVVQRIAQPLSAHIEGGTIDSHRGQGDIARILQPLRHVELLVLACTHYPAITTQLQRHVPNARMFNPASAVATELHPLLAHSDGGDLRVITTGDAQATRAAARRAWGHDPGACQRVTI